MKEEMEKLYNDLLRIKEEKRKHGLETMQYKIEKGKEIIDPSKHQSWEEYVIRDTNGCFFGYITECALEIMMAIEEGKTLEEIKEIEENQNQTEMTSNGIRDLVNKYSKKGYPIEEKPMSLREMSLSLKNKRGN